MQRSILLAVYLTVLLTSCVAEPEGPKAAAGGPKILHPSGTSQAAPASPSPPPPSTSPEPRFAGSIVPVDRARLTHSWREGCPVGVEDLRLLTITHWGFDGQVHTGELVLHRDQAQQVFRVMQQLFEIRFPIARVELVDKYGGDDDLSGEANNTSAFNCREVEDSPGVWSQHAFGRAIDINPVQNPYISRSGKISPSSGRPYLDRLQRLPGMIHATDAVVASFRSIGWEWGGHWSASKDYQHFSQTGR